jgi:hypothetical protein
MATMHQRQSPLTSGRIVLWRTMPVLFISPIVSSFVNDHDLEIYLPVSYAFLILILLQYRRLCHEWSAWMTNIPEFCEGDVADWWSSRSRSTTESDSVMSGSSGASISSADGEFHKSVQSYRRFKLLRSPRSDPMVTRVARAMPYIDWLLAKEFPSGDMPRPFSAAWFNSLSEAKKNQKQISRGLKEHNVLMLFRHARYDIGQNLALFLVALMDRWVALTMQGRKPQVSMYTDFRARYGLCVCLLYFCFSVMALDVTLQSYWEEMSKNSDEKLLDFVHAQKVLADWGR